MTLRRSPTLALAAAVAAARGHGDPAWSLSTPTFEDRAGDLDPGPAATLLSPPRGMARLCTRIREGLSARWNLPDHEVLITAGAKAAILCALRAVGTAGDRVLIVAPSWPSYADIARLLFMQPVLLETRFDEGFAVDPAALASTMARTGARAIVLANPGNPTGRIHPGTELGGIAEVAREFEALLLIDESFSGIVFDRDKWRASTCPVYERLVVVDSFSKSHHLQGLRVGSCAAQGQLFEEIVCAHQTVASAAPSLSQAAALALLDANDAPLDYRREREMALGFVRDRGWACYPPEGSFYLFPRIGGAGGIDAVEAAGNASNVFLLRGEAFGASYGDHVRLCFGKPLAELERIFTALGGGSTGGTGDT